MSPPPCGHDRRPPPFRRPGSPPCPRIAEPGGVDGAVGELAEELPISRPAVSQHLRVLKDAGLVEDEAAGTRRVYRLNPAGVSALRDQLDMFWRRTLEGFQEIVEDEEKS